MTFSFKYRNQLIFHYNPQDEDLKCPYCEQLYAINSSKIKSVLSQIIKDRQFEWPQIYMRCIDCDLNNPEYPFIFNDDNNHFKPNKEQKYIIENLYQEILITTQNDFIHNFFLIEGYAGTGKTSVITYLLKYPEFNRFKICFSAPTNKALNVLMDKLNGGGHNSSNSDIRANNDDLVENDEKENEWEFKTVFKLLGNKMTINSQGETLFDFNQNEEFKNKYDIIIIDEVSMVEKQQVEHLLNKINNLKRDNHLGLSIPILIFLGDIGQLPPTTEDYSVIFDQSLQKKYEIRKLILTEIMRSKDKLTNLSLKIRELIPMELEKKIKKDLYGVDLKKLSDAQINFYNNKDLWINDYAQSFKENLHSACQNKNATAPIILAYTNPECDYLNDICRRLIFNDPTEKYVKGELLVFNSYYSIGRQKTIPGKDPSIEDYYYVKFYTSDPVIVKHVDSAIIKIESLDFANLFKSKTHLIEKVSKKITRLKISKHNKEYLIKEIISILSKWSFDAENKTIHSSHKSMDLLLNQLSSKINSIDHSYEIYSLSVDGSDKLDPLDTDLDHCPITVIKDINLDRYQINCKEIKNKIKSCYQNLNNAFKNNQPMKFLIDYIFQQIWLNYYYKMYIWPFADISYGYAITTHKSQGSTYVVIYVTAANILGCVKVNNIVKSKSLYTAVTRASKRVVIYHHKQTLLPLLPNDKLFKCNWCHLSKEGKDFPTVNCTIDKQCADQVLLQIKSNAIYQLNNESIIFSDKNKNLYEIPKDEINEVHINDAISFIYSSDLQKTDIDKYQYSNLSLARDIIQSQNHN